MTEPLATSARGTPLLWDTLGASFHLEALAEEDAPRLVALGERIEEWFGKELRFSWSSVAAEVGPHDPSDFELLSSLATRLHYAPDPTLTSARARRGHALMSAARLDRFGVMLHGGRERNEASPFSFRFFARVGPPDDRGILTTRAHVGFTVPRESDLDDFRTRVIAIAGELRLRWGCAGLSYAGWEVDRYGDTRAAIFAHSQRHPGFDHGQHVTLMDLFHERVRTVSHLTFVGPALAAKLRPNDIVGDDLVAVAKAGDAILFRAGERPEEGDVNRDRIPLAYARVDRKLKGIRAFDRAHFMAPWTERTSESWLRRFEGAL